ncbi:hypothetical protein [Streptomyces xanthophaeus]|uniref:hypothetical protein n=1 Tax=Streptomyces xanthophaeus TaxID=67385 RepID=UPI0004CC9851|nr:hypothetical protein [Streptomyces xanthophaeus]
MPRAKPALARAALDAWPDWLEALRDADGHAPSLDSPGTFVVLGAQAPPTAVRNFDAVQAALKECAEPQQEVQAEDIPACTPRPTNVRSVPSTWNARALSMLAPSSPPWSTADAVWASPSSTARHPAY